MHDHYAGKWYRTMTFVQKTTAYDSTGQATVTTWYESLSLPGTIRIDMGSAADGNGVLASRDSTFVFQKGALTGRRAGGNISACSRLRRLSRTGQSNRRDGHKLRIRSGQGAP